MQVSVNKSHRVCPHAGTVLSKNQKRRADARAVLKGLVLRDRASHKEPQRIRFHFDKGPEEQVDRDGA